MTRTFVYGETNGSQLSLGDGTAVGRSGTSLNPAAPGPWSYPTSVLTSSWFWIACPRNQASPVGSNPSLKPKLGATPTR
jgi:hypothetical protein